MILTEILSGLILLLVGVFIVIVVLTIIAMFLAQLNLNVDPITNSYKNIFVGFFYHLGIVLACLIFFWKKEVRSEVKEYLTKIIKRG